MPAGRPKKEIDYEQLDKLCKLQCTGEECASFFGIDYDTLNARIKEQYDCNFSDYYKKNSGEGKISLRRMQWKTAEGGNPTMQIWLGKQYLGQSDKQEVEHGGSVKHSYIAEWGDSKED